MKTKTDPRSVMRDFKRWLSRRMLLALRCEASAAKRGDHATALRFEHEHNALAPVMEQLASEMRAIAPGKR